MNYVYGTSGVLRALETVGLASQPDCQRAADWLRSVQNPDGGFGESILSYYDPSLKGKGQEHCFADCVGLDRSSGGCRAGGSGGRARRCLARRASERGRFVGRRGIYRHRFPLRFLFEVSFVSELLPALRSGTL